MPTCRSPRRDSSTATDDGTLNGLRPLTTIVLLLGVMSGTAQAAVQLRHQVAATDTAESLQLARACYGLQIEGTRLLCHGAPFLTTGGRFEAGVLLKANERAYAVVSRALDKDIDQKYLDDLFALDNFQDVSGHATLGATYGGTSLSLTPLHAVGAFKLANPSLPEVHVAGAGQTLARVSQNVVLRRWPAGDWVDLLITPSVFYYSRNYAFIDTDVLSLVGASPKKAVKKHRTRGVDGDLGIDLLSRRSWLPSLGLRTFNVANPDPCEPCRAAFIDVERTLRTSSEVSVSYAIPHPVGQSLVAATMPWQGAFEAADPLEAGLSYAYKLSKLGCYASYSPLIYRFGFVFDAEGFRLGVLYTDEKQENALQLERRKQTYVYTSVYL